MKTTTLRLHESDCKSVLLPLLRGRALHVTCAAHVPAIAAAGAILPNSDGSFTSSFGSSTRSFFRLRGCVSVFNYRSATDERIEDSLWRCSPWQMGRRCKYELAIYMLSPATCAVLESTQLWHEQQAYDQMVVPQVEAGHPGAIPLSAIDELICVSIDHQSDWLERALERL
jgi:hypothetical protein